MNVKYRVKIQHCPSVKYYGEPLLIISKTQGFVGYNKKDSYIINKDTEGYFYFEVNKGYTFINDVTGCDKSYFEVYLEYTKKNKTKRINLIPEMV